MQEAQCQIDDDGGGDLYAHGIGCGAEEAFDLEVLFDRSEEQFDQPAGLVELGDFFRARLQVIRAGCL